MMKSSPHEKKKFRHDCVHRKKNPTRFIIGVVTSFLHESQEKEDMKRYSRINKVKVYRFLN